MARDEAITGTDTDAVRLLKALRGGDAALGGGAVQGLSDAAFEGFLRSREALELARHFLVGLQRQVERHLEVVSSETSELPPMEAAPAAQPDRSAPDPSPEAAPTEASPSPSAGGIAVSARLHRDVGPDTPEAFNLPLVQPVISDQPKFILPNGRVGERFAASLRPRHGATALRVHHIEIDPSLGLRYDSVSGEITGTPRRDGEYQLTVHYYVLSDSLRRVAQVIIPFVVTPDPRSLWRSLPSQVSDPFWKPDTASLLMQAGSRRLLAASKRGRSHAHTAQFRDDHFKIVYDEESLWSVLAVADGAGSARLSRRGSQVAAERATEATLAGLRGEYGRQILAAAERWPRHGSSPRPAVPESVYKVMAEAALQATKAITAEVQRLGPEYNYKDFSTTLLLAAARPVEHGLAVATFWCGDGAIGILRRGIEVELLGEVDSGEYAGQTRFLDNAVFKSYADIQRRLRFCVVEEPTALVLMTDGVSDPCFETERQLKDIGCWDELWTKLAPRLMEEDPAYALLGWLDFWSQGNHDDRTIALLW